MLARSIKPVVAICILLRLIAACVAQSRGKKRGQAKPKPTPESVQPQTASAARRALKVLRRMETVVEVGANYAEHTRRLTDAKIEIDDLLPLVPSDGPESRYKPKQDIITALDSYVAASRYWKMLIDNKYRDLDRSYRELMQLAWKRARLSASSASEGLDAQEQQSPPTTRREGRGPSWVQTGPEKLELDKTKN